ncbi:MAG: ABC transporter permease [Kofleriaceae bacterium]
MSRGLDRARAALIALLTATAAGSLLMILAGAAPAAVWRALVASALGDGYGVGQVLFRATPLVFTGLAVAVPRRAGLFNIGGEGQLATGALAAAVVAAGLPADVSGWVAVPAALVAAMAGGGMLGAITGALRVCRGTHEVVVAILLNFIVAGVMLWLGNRWLFVGEATRTATIVDGATLPSLGLAGSSASVSVVGAVLAAGVVAWVFARTTVGFTWRAVGTGRAAARAAGLPVRRAQISAMAVGGALAGLAGAHFVLGHKHAFETGLGRGAGFVGVAVALLAQGDALAMIASALVFAILAQGGLGVAATVPKEMFDVLQAVVMLVVAASLGRRARR